LCADGAGADAYRGDQPVDRPVGEPRGAPGTASRRLARRVVAARGDWSRRRSGGVQRGLRARSRRPRSADAPVHRVRARSIARQWARSIGSPRGGVGVNALVAGLMGAALGLGVLMVIAGVRGTEDDGSAARSRSWLRIDQLNWRLGSAIVVALLVSAVTRWPV